MTDDVLVEQRDHILLIAINRPAARNAIDAAVTKGIAAALDDLDGRKELSIGILTGTGGTFCAGMDLKAVLRGENVVLPGRGLAGLTEAPPKKPLIAAVEGYALAGGCELAERITANAPLSIAVTKEIITKSADWSSAEMFSRQEGLMRPVFESADAREGASAFAEKRAPVWRGE